MPRSPDAPGDPGSAGSPGSAPATRLADLALTTTALETLVRCPTHQVLRDLSIAARDKKLLASKEFKRLTAYLLELADGRDRREPWTTRPGDTRPIPKLRIAIDECFGMYGDVFWFRLNQASNKSGRPLVGLFARMAASMGRVRAEDFAAVVSALIAPSPEAAVLKLLQTQDGKVKGMGLEMFSRLAYAYRRDLYFLIPRDWGETSGCLKYLGNDLRKYCAMCRNLRDICDDLGVPQDVRGAVVDHLMTRPKPPPRLMEAMHRSMGASLARYSGLDADDAYEPTADDDEESAMPARFSERAIRARRGRRDLRETLCAAYGNRCAITGSRVKPLLEVAHIMPYPTGMPTTAVDVILLRADVHTLWDLNLIGVEPGTLRVHVAPPLHGTPYEKLAARTLLERKDEAPIAHDPLHERWRMFTSAHAKAAGQGQVKDGDPPAPAQSKATHRHQREVTESEQESHDPADSAFDMPPIRR